MTPAIDTEIIEALQVRLAARLGTGPATITGMRPFGDGHSGITYQLDLHVADRVRPCVLRLSPPGRTKGPSDVGRQGRIMGALAQAGFPAPEVIDCDSDAVLVERSFALMERVEGHGWEDAARVSSDRDVADLAVDALCQLRTLDPGRLLPGELPASPVEELGRWTPLLDRATDVLGTGDQPLLERLRATAPAPGAPGLVHGDFHYGNLLFRDGAIVAVVDWEIASIGEPLMDLGCLAVATLRRRYAPEPNPTGSVDVALGHLVERFGSTPGEANWFLAASCLKYAAIIAFNLSLHRRGKIDDPVYEALQQTIVGLLTDGQTILEDGLDAV